MRRIRSWLMTRRVRRHPDFASQKADYLRLKESGELFEDMGFSPGTIEELRRENDG